MLALSYFSILALTGYLTGKSLSIGPLPAMFFLPTCTSVHVTPDMSQSQQQVEIQCLCLCVKFRIS